MTLSVNPYIAGNPVGTTDAFVGRQDVLREVLRTLRQPHSNAILLFGQRRIGKTSVLQCLQARLPEQGPYCPVYFDLQDKADWPLARVLGDLARTIAHALDHPEPVEGWSDPETAFREEWLPTVLDGLPPDCSLELLFDEFDVLADPQKRQAADTFFPYLRGLLASDPARLQFVFVIGRNVDDLDTIALSLFKSAPYRRVSLLDQEETVELVHLSQANNTLTWPDEAVERVWQLTHGHPFLTQRLCSDVWERAYDKEPKTPPTVSPADVDAAVPDTLEASRNTLEWLWDGLGPAERVVTSALAEAGPGPISEDELGQLLRESGVRILIRELQNAPQLLKDWDILEPANGGYRFRVELLRRWVAEHNPLSRVQEDLERIEPVADNLFRAASGLYRGEQLEQAVPLLRQAVALNPNHVRANQLLADILLAQGNLEEARHQLERLYEYYPGAARPRLIQAILTQAQATTDEDEQLTLYERVLELDLTQREAITGKRRVWEQRGDAALKDGDLDTALRAFQEAGLFEDRTEVQVLEQLYKRQPTVVRSRLIQACLEQAQTAESADERLEIYNRVLELDSKQPEALTGKGRIWEQRGDDALTVDDLDGALEAYRTAGLSDKAAEVEKRIRRRELEAGLQNLEILEKKESYQEALALARELAGEFPDAKKWNTDLKRLECKEELENHYQRALDALKSGDTQTAQTLLAHVVALEAGYKEATRYLHLAVTGEDVAQLKEQLGQVPPETEGTVEQELEEHPIIETDPEEELKVRQTPEQELQDLQEQPRAEQPSEPSLPPEEKTEPPSQRQLSPWNPLDHLRLLWWILVAPQQLQVHRGKRRVGECLAATLIWLPLLIPALALNVGMLPRAETNTSSLFNLLIGIALVFTWLLTSLMTDSDYISTANAAMVAGFVVALGLMGREADNAVLTLEFVVISAGVLIAVGFVALVIGFWLTGLSEGFGLITMMAGILTALIIAPIVASDKVGGVKLSIGGVLLDIVAGIVAGTAVGIVAYHIEKSLKAGRSSWLVRGVFVTLLLICAFLVWFSFLDGWQVFSSSETISSPTSPLATSMPNPTLFPPDASPDSSLSITPAQTFYPDPTATPIVAPKPGATLFYDDFEQVGIWPTADEWGRVEWLEVETTAGSNGVLQLTSLAWTGVRRNWKSVPDSLTCTSCSIQVEGWIPNEAQAAGYAIVFGYRGQDSYYIFDVRRTAPLSTRARFSFGEGNSERVLGLGSGEWVDWTEKLSHTLRVDIFADTNSDPPLMLAAGYADGELVDVVELESYPADQPLRIGLGVVSEASMDGVVNFDNFRISELPEDFYPLEQP